MAILSSANKYSGFGLLVMRLGVGVMMILHGYPKLTGGPEKWGNLGEAMTNIGVNFAPQFWGFMAGFSEAVGGLLLLLGLFFRPACFLLMFTMAIAAVHHLAGGDTVMDASHALELACVFLGLFFVGPGKYSFDKK